jgi:phage tail sheath protein FI
MAALLDLRMPGVYTQEIPTLPPTVGVIPSAVPVFIGYTDKAERKGENIRLKPTRVKSMREYEEWFGTAPLVNIEVEIDDTDNNPRRPEVKLVPITGFNFKMYHAMLLYYSNGGGPCYVTSVGDFNSGPGSDALIEGIKPAIKVKDITILIFPDGTSLTDNNYKLVIEQALNHCVKMKNRVTVIDVNNAFGEDLDQIESVFQTNMPSDIDIKKYGMAYYPFLETGLSYAYSADRVSVKNYKQTLKAADVAAADALAAATKTGLNDYKTAVAGLKTAQDKKSFLDALKSAMDAAKAANANITVAQLKDVAKKVSDKWGQPVPASVKAIFDANAGDPFPPLATEITTAGTAVTTATTELTNKKTAYDTAGKAGAKGFTAADGKTTISVYTGASLSVLQDANNALYGKIREAIQNFPVTMPPSSAIAGIYVRSDANQGVWKAPANVSVFGTIKPSIDIDDDMHAELNAPSNGKAINVIRTYPGRGILVYGARTLAGNDLEWRYVSVRRTFCFIEDSIARAMQDFVFEPNTQQTWIKVKAMIRSFLNRLWKAGGLFGNTPEDAYEVVCGEPESFSVEEMLSGIMRVFIKVAVARPAEFIVLQYEHKFELAEA